MPLADPRTSKEICDEIELAFGFVPPFFEPAIPNPSVLESLWHQTETAYLANPLPALFKERLNAALSRFCIVPYCMICHSSALHPLGMTAPQVLALLETPVPIDSSVQQSLSTLNGLTLERHDFPSVDSPEERALIACTTVLFLENPQTELCQEALESALGGELYNNLVLYLSYIKTCHLWAETHPEISYEADQRAQLSLGALLAEEPALGEFFQDYQEKVGLQRFSRKERQAAKEMLQESEAHAGRLLMLTAEVGRALTTHHSLHEMLKLCAEALVKHLDAAFARIWVLDAAENILVLHASAGQYTHLNGPHGRVPMGQFKIGLIAEERSPHLTNSVIGDPRVSDQAWALREGMVAFAGYPLIVEDRLVGVVALFARQKLPDLTLQALGSVANQIAVGIDRMRTEEDLRYSGERLRAALSASGTGTFRWDIQTNTLDWDEGLDRLFGLTPGDSARSLESFVSMIHPDDRLEVLDRCQRCAADGGDFETAFRTSSSDGSLRWLDSKGKTFLDEAGRPRYLTGACTDITSQRQIQQDLQARAIHEQLLNHIGQALRSTSDPEAVQSAAITLLGEALGADRCYFGLYDLNQGIVSIGHDWYQKELTSIQGTYPFPNTVDMFQELYGGLNTSVINDASNSSLSPQTLANMERLGLRSRISVALVDGAGLMATLTAAMAHGPRDWTTEEVALVEAVGTQLRSALEMARVTQREHRIATQLQEALQPPLPKYVPGLSVASFTRPALKEAQIGGDFFDLFPLDKELYGLVIGDVSGKGLAAAQQLALIRNSLRTTLYLYRTPAQAASSLNAIVTAHDLLAGFVTAFVGVYDVAAGTITYASCGHEPGLVRHSGGIVEELVTTGPPLGVDQNAVYSEASVTLTEGDTLLLYTDGVSEAGPNRRNLLGTAGLARLFAQLPKASEMQREAEDLVAQVSRFAAGVFHDDVAVIIARRQ